MRFRNRAEAGRRLAERLDGYRGRPDTLVLALPRGGVPVAVEVARALEAPLDVFLVRKLGLPGQEELAIGAIASGGIRFLNEDLVRTIGVPEDTIAAIAAREQVELERRERVYRGDRPAAKLAGRAVILVDDGLATGASMHAAVMAARQQGAARIVVAVPVAPPETCAEFRNVADDVVCVETPEPFRAVGLWYVDFDEVSDQEVRDLLASVEAPPAAGEDRPGIGPATA